MYSQNQQDSTRVCCEFMRVTSINYEISSQNWMNNTVQMGNFRTTCLLQRTMSKFKFLLDQISLHTCLVTFLILCQTSFIRTSCQERFEDSGGDLELVSQVNIPTNVVTLDLSYNKITRLYDGDFSQLSHLKSLYLIGNEISIIDPGTFTSLTTLVSLHLYQNKITEFPVLTNLAELRELSLHHNEISNLPDEVFIPDNNKLERLDLSYLKITNVPVNFLKHFSALKELNICCGKLVAAPPVYELANSLQILKMESNSITMLESRSFTDGTTPSSLQELWLGNNMCSIEDGLLNTFLDLSILNINSMGLRELPDLSGIRGNLRELNIEDNQLTSLNPNKLLGNPPDFSQTAAIRQLKADNNSIVAIDPKVLASMPNLENIELGFNQMKTFPLTSLALAHSIQFINLESNNIETLPEWDASVKGSFKIDITGNPLHCNTLCWFVQSGFATYDQNEEKLPCAQPKEMISYSWQQITSSPELICDYEPTTDESPGTDGKNITKDEEDEGSSNILIIVISIGVAVFVIAVIVAVFSVVRRYMIGKKEPDVILIGKNNDVGLSKKNKNSEKDPEEAQNGRKPNTVREKKDSKEPLRRRQEPHQNRQSKNSRTSPRTSKLQTINENGEVKSDNRDKSKKDNGHRTRERSERDKHNRNKDYDRNKNKTDCNRHKKQPRKSDDMTFDRNPMETQEIPFEYTYKV